jgi:hypothetical protein
VEAPLPSNSPRDHMILRVDLVGSHGRWKRTQKQDVCRLPGGAAEATAKRFALRPACASQRCARAPRPCSALVCDRAGTGCENERDAEHTRERRRLRLGSSRNRSSLPQQHLTRGVWARLCAAPGDVGGDGDVLWMGPPSFQFAPAKGIPSASLPVPLVVLSMLAQFFKDADGYAALASLPPPALQRLLTLLLEKTRAVVDELVQGGNLYGRHHTEATELLVFGLGHATALVAALRTTTQPAESPAGEVKQTPGKKPPPPPPPLGLTHLTALFVDTVAKALGAFGSRALLRGEAAQLRMVLCVTTLCGDVASARALLTHSRGRPLLHALVAARHLSLPVRGQAMAAVLRVAAHCTHGEDETDPDSGLTGPLRHLLMDSDNPTELIDLLLDTAHGAMAALPAADGAAEAGVASDSERAAAAALLEGATATLMFVATTRVQLTDQQLRRLLAVCAGGPHRARQFAAAAVRPT